MSIYPSRTPKVTNQPLWPWSGIAFANFFCLLLILMAVSKLADRVSDVERTTNTTSTTSTTSTMLEVVKTKIMKTVYQSKLYGMRKKNREAVENEAMKLSGKIEGLTGLLREYNSMMLEELKKAKTVTVTKHEDIDYLKALVVDLERKKGVYTTGRVEHVTDSEVVFKYSPSPSFGDPAHCFPLKGSRGFVEIRFEHAIVFDSITLEHLTKSYINSSSAPKLCLVYGGLRGPASESGTTSAPTDMKNLRFLTGFFYDPNDGNAQTFNVLNLAASNIVDTIRFDFISNHGHDNYTCIYGLRVNGHAPV